MNDPERLLTSHVSERELRLLRAGAAEEPPHDGAARLAIALGVAPASAATPDASAPRALPQQPGAGSAATPAIGGSAAKWMAAVAAGAIVVAGAVLLVPRTPSERSAPAAREGEASAPPAPEAAPALPERSEPAAPAAEPAGAVRSIADEIAKLERVRVLLTRRDGRGALQLLAAYEREHAGGALREEAHFMRVQALAASGQRAEARRSARGFERLYPKSVHSARVRTIAESLGGR